MEGGHGGVPARHLAGILNECKGILEEVEVVAIHRPATSHTQATRFTHGVAGEVTRACARDRLHLGWRGRLPSNHESRPCEIPACLLGRQTHPQGSAHLGTDQARAVDLQRLSGPTRHYVCLIKPYRYRPWDGDTTQLSYDHRAVRG